MVAITFATMLATAAAIGLPGVLLVPLRQEFVSGSADISGAMALRLILFGLVGPFAAALMQRYGLRVTVSAALCLIVFGLAVASRATALWEIWVGWGVMVGLGTGMTAIVLGATVASRWFVRRRGLVLGVLTASAATGQLAFLPVAAWIAETAGWRLSVLPAVAMCAIVCVLIVLFAADSPSSVGLRPYGSEEASCGAIRPALRPKQDSRDSGAISLALSALIDASATRMFWVLFLTFAVCGFTTTGLVQTHFIPMCQDFGMPELAGAGVLAAMGLFDFAGTIGSGWLSDRVDNRSLLSWYYGLRGIALLLLPLSNFDAAGLGVFAVFYGLEWIATVPPTVRLAVQTFGGERAPLVFGWIFTGHQLGAALGALGAGIVRDQSGSYLPAFAIGGVLCFIAAGLAVAVRVRPQPLPARSVVAQV